MKCDINLSCCSNSHEYQPQEYKNPYQLHKSNYGRGWRSNLKNSNITYNAFRSPTNPEKAPKRNRNVSNFASLASKILNKSRNSTFMKLQLLGRENEEGAAQKVYDDELVRTMSEEFTDRVRTFFVIGDAIRAFRGSLNRSELGANEFIEIALNKIASRKRIFREDIAKLTKIAPVTNNFMMPFMNGGPAGENWDNATNGFYDWIDNKTQETILGIELGFKADSYGLEVSKRLIAKKNKTPSIRVNLLIDGFVSILMQKPPATLSDFERNTIRMIDDMRKAGINVFDNDSWNPLSADFLAANHIKLWIFDGRLAFVGGIGIESQFRTLLYDEMDSIQGPFVKVLTAMALLLMTNQKGHEDLDNQQLNVKQIYQMNQEELKKLFIKDTLDQGSVNMRISMDVPGFVQDAQQDYIDLLTRKDVDEIFIMAPYFSDHKVAKALVIAADRLVLKYGPQKSQSKLKVAATTKKGKNLQLGNHTLTPTESDSNTEKKIHVIFPKKPEDRIIAEVSRYYAYYLRKNPIVETLQFYAEVNSEKFEMLHAKQMIVVLKDESRNWTKYVKFGGSYNPAGRAQNMWEINTVSINRSWDDSDEGPNAAEDNPIKNYLQNVMKVVTTKYTQPFPWGHRDEKLSLMGRIEMGIARSLWF